MEPQILAAYAVGVPIIIFIVEAVKKIGLPVKIAPLLSLVLGIGFVYLVSTEAPELSLTTVIVQGALVGMAASGAYSGVKGATKNEMSVEVRAIPDDPL